MSPFAESATSSTTLLMALTFDKQRNERAGDWKISIRKLIARDSG